MRQQRTQRDLGLIEPYDALLWIDVYASGKACVGKVYEKPTAGEA